MLGLDRHQQRGAGSARHRGRVVDEKVKKQQRNGVLLMDEEKRREVGEGELEMVVEVK